MHLLLIMHVYNVNVYRYFALELCQTSLNQLFSNDDNEKYRGPMPQTKKDVLCQLADGLKYIHANQLIHRDIKPANVLIWVDYDETACETVLVKWADFGLSKPVNERDTCSWTGPNLGTRYWKAPEILALDEDENVNWTKQRGDKKGDVFAEGLVFAYYLLNGQHPHKSTNDLEIPMNIINGNIVKIEGKVYITLRDVSDDQQ